MTDVSADAAATLKAMEEVLAKYDGYPANDVRKARDAIKTRQVRRSREGILVYEGTLSLFNTHYLAAPILSPRAERRRGENRTKLICPAALRVYPLAAHRSCFVHARHLAWKYTSLPAWRGPPLSCCTFRDSRYT